MWTWASRWNLDGVLQNLVMNWGLLGAEQSVEAELETEPESQMMAV